MKHATLIFLLFLTIKTSAQISTEHLTGKWNCYHKELEDGTITSTDLFSGEEFEYSCNDLTLELKENGMGTESQGGLEFKYVLQDTLIQLGNRIYVVELLNQENLTLRDYDPDGMMLSVFRQKFRKQSD